MIYVCVSGIMLLSIIIIQHSWHDMMCFLPIIVPLVLHMIANKTGPSSFTKIKLSLVYIYNNWEGTCAYVIWYLHMQACNHYFCGLILESFNVPLSRGQALHIYRWSFDMWGSFAQQYLSIDVANCWHD